ncbi:hypothetical protein ACFWJT_13970 [Streptomyces sp. NPDC127069]|uniref:hypothetical protein n=1 Tax=Streptomyces sp. NPDC127069 TaxID=3347128 RepID=UPI0036532704
MHFACVPAFEHLAREAGVGFEPLSVTRNPNTGVAEATEQDTRETPRLAEFLDATRGAVPALLADPDGVLDTLRSAHRRLRPDWYVVDQLSYPVTLALHCLGVPYATFCPGHPSYVLSGPDAYFGSPTPGPTHCGPIRSGCAN